MKRFFLLLCVICVLYGLSWPKGLGESTEGTLTPVTLSHTTNCDSARVYFGYPSSNLYYDLKLFPFTADSSELVRDSLDLDSIGGHYVEVRIYERGATTPEYTLALWEHKDPTPGDTIQREASTFDVSSDSTFPDLSHLANRPAIGDTNTNPFDPSVDVVARVAYVDSVDTVITEPTDGGSDTTAIKAMHDNRGTSIFSVDSDSVIAKYCDTTRVVGDAGAAQKNTEEEIKGWVKVTLIDTVDVARDATKDDYKDGAGAGTGSNQVIIRTKSSTDSAVIPGATVAIWNADQSALMGLLSTDTDSGKAVFAQNNGMYNLRIQAYKFQWTVPITIGVSGNKDTTVYATEFTPSPPPSSDLCTVYGYIDSIGLVGQRAQISCTILEQELRIGTKILAYYSYTKTVFTNPSGYWEMFLPPNAIITPSGTQYVFEIKTPYQPVLKKWVTVPELANWEFIF